MTDSPQTNTASERKRLSIPRADESVLEWWDAQTDPALSVRLLIRGEIERNGYTDTAYRPVAQLPRRGRPPVEAATQDGDAGADRAQGPEPQKSEPAVHPVAQVDPDRVEVPAATRAASGSDDASALDALMNG